MSLRVVIAGGGTGGHLYPGLAVAEELRARGDEILFVGTARGIEARVIPAAGYELELLEVSALKRMGFVGAARGLSRLPSAIFQARKILKRFRPDVVLGVGGYASGPVGLAAVSSRLPLALQEQNSVPGMTNRKLGRFARRVFLGFEDAARFFPPGRTEVSGNPVRRAFLTSVARAPASSVTGRLLVVGGSQGARAVNDLVAGAMETLAASGRSPVLLHQAGAADEARIKECYAAKAFARVEVRAFVDDMVGAYGAADLVVARAGALTLAELAVMGKPAVLIPLPTAADDHQSKNAASFRRAGAAEVFAQTGGTGQALAWLIGGLLSDAPRLATMAAAMRALGRPGAARTVADGLARFAKP